MQYRVHPTTKFIVYLLNQPYGFVVQVHVLGKPGYPVEKYFLSLREAEPFYEQMIRKYSEV